ncbi:MAG: mannonate dehydratase [Gemmatimonadota bacterium]
MRIALQLDTTDEDAGFARRVGVEHVVWGGPESPLGYLDLEILGAARRFFADRGLSLGVIENVPVTFYDRAMLGLPGRDVQIDNVCRTLTSMGRAGIPVLGYHWMALGGISTDQIRGRGGALERHFDLEAARRAPAAALDWRGPVRPGRSVHLPDVEVGAEQMWDNLVYFLRRVVPAAEAAGVKLAAHPDDAPIPEFLGVARILGSPAGLQRLIDSVPSPANGIDFCQGTISEMPGVDVLEAIRAFGRQGKIHFAHFRDTRGTVPKFTEVFMDEGDTDMLAAVEAYRQVGYDGLIRADHTPWIVGDSPRAHRGFAFQIGYMRGLEHTVAQRGTGVPPSGEPPDLALAVDADEDEELLFAQQFGVSRVTPRAASGPPHPGSPGEAARRNRVAQAGLAWLDPAPGKAPVALTNGTGADGGQADPQSLERALAEATPGGVVVVDRPAAMPDASDWPHQVQAFGAGYLRARLQGIG